MSKPKVLLNDTMSPQAIDILIKHVKLERSYPYPWKTCKDTVVYTRFTPTKTKCTVACPCTGVEHINSPHIIHLDDEWKRTEGQKVTATAEHTISLMLQLAKKCNMQLANKNLLIIGYGRIGQMVSKISLSLGMKVCYYDKCYFNDKYHARIAFDVLIKEADIVSLHVPLDDATKNMIDEKVFWRMEKGTLLINTSRYEVVDHNQLIQALNSGVLGGFAHDFSDKHALDEKLYNIVQTPHIGGATKESRIATDIYIARKILQHLEVNA